MEIPNNAPDVRSSAMRFDVTKPMREVTDKLQPLAPPKATDESSAQAPETSKTKDPGTIEAARAQHRANFQQRVSDQRTRYLANHAVERAEAATQARSAYAAKRKAAAATNNASIKPETTTDAIDISNDGQKLIDSILARAAKLDDPARAQRVQDLRERYLQGKLNTDALVERSADKLLRGE